MGESHRGVNFGQLIIGNRDVSLKETWQVSDYHWSLDKFVVLSQGHGTRFILVEIEKHGGHYRLFRYKK